MSPKEGYSGRTQTLKQMIWVYLYKTGNVGGRDTMKLNMDTDMSDMSKVGINE
jgi:hypothetical protein